MSQSRSILALIVALVCLAAAVPPTVLAQRRDQDKSPSAGMKSVPVFKGIGLDRVARGKKPPPPSPPQELSPLVFTDIAKQMRKVEPGSTYVTLDPSHPAVVNKGVLLFWDAYLVESGQNYVYWGEKQWRAGAPGSVGLWIRSPASHQYLIDCRVSGYQFGLIGNSIGRRGASFKVFGPDGNAELFDFSNNIVLGNNAESAGFTGPFDLFNYKNTGAHLVFVLTAATSGWYGFQIVPEGGFSKQYSQGVAQWAFFSCEVKNL